LLSTIRKEYIARKKIHSPRERAKKGGYIQKRKGYIRRAKLDFEFLLFLIYFIFYLPLYVYT
jgi:hypothetical protein